jgi:hypothetical protein
MNDDICKKVVDDFIKKTPGALDVLYDIMQKLKKGGVWPSWYVDAIVQKHWEGYDLYDAFWFARINMFYAEGGLGTGLIKVGAEPLKDREIEGNNNLLQDLPDGFSAVFRGGTYDCDGDLVWNHPIELDCVLDMNTHKFGTMIVPAHNASLEVGTTTAWRTWFHLYETQSVARWCYGSKDIVVLMLSEEAQRNLHKRIWDEE